LGLEKKKQKEKGYPKKGPSNAHLKFVMKETMLGKWRRRGSKLGEPGRKAVRDKPIMKRKKKRLGKRSMRRTKKDWSAAAPHDHAREDKNKSKDGQNGSLEVA